MTWVRRQADQPTDRHQCPRPERGQWPFRTAAADYGDLWRCDTCGTLWQADYACQACRRYGHGPHGGQHTVGTAWRLAGWWTCWRNRLPREPKYRSREPPPVSQGSYTGRGRPLAGLPRIHYADHLTGPAEEVPTDGE